MSHIINLPTFRDNRGKLTVIENIIPFKVKRVYYMYETIKKRGGHRHVKTIQALVCLCGSCEIFVNNGISSEIFLLNKPSKCLIINPEYWHEMFNFSENSILLVLASELYDAEDYIYENYK